MSLSKTRAMRKRVAKDLRPLFDHCVHLAQSAHKQSKESGREYLARRAGLDLLHARRLVGK
jgi:hypothetical protein